MLLDAGARHRLLAILSRPLGESHSLWDQVKREPKRSTVPQLKDFLDHLRCFQEQNVAASAFQEIPETKIRQFAAGFRTGFLTKDSLAYIESKIDGYRAVKDTQQRYLAGNGKQPGDPEMAAAILIELAETEQPPLHHLYLREDAYNRASGKLAAMAAELQKWKSTTISADYKLGL